MNSVADINRERYISVNQKAAQIGKFAEPSKIRIEVDLKNGVGSYQFNIKKTDITNQREISLDRNDVFVASRWGIFPVLQSLTNPSTEILASFPAVNDGTNPSVHAVGFQDNSIEALYNGTLSWSVDNTVMLSSYPTESFRKVPEQQGAFLLNGEEAAVNEGIKVQWNIEDATDYIIPCITIPGTRDHRINVNFDAAGLNFPVTEGYKPVLVLYMEGFLVKSGCEYQGGDNPFKAAVGQW